jgi:uncharacterized RDD family membrane protein YckC
MSQAPLDSTSSTVDAPLTALPPPGFWKRVFCILYEQLILLGVLALLFLLPNLALGILFGVSLPTLQNRPNPAPTVTPAAAPNKDDGA